MDIFLIVLFSGAVFYSLLIPPIKEGPIHKINMEKNLEQEVIANKEVKSNV
ncbi:hypothetical protein [Bacillus sp. Marseille-P3661]|uniref:hypothetical protein n=1 Tax=Bacillus sp. Marseille-P3661 TaxID=1936234 RepID=UPI0015E17AA7|nr:hypothetical protein [Bacillus sp. Marseille-P3661]